MNILICDDNQDVVIQEEFVVEEALVAIKKRGNIRTFTSAKACLTAVEENKKEYGIIFLDIEMPYISGLELGKKIKEINPMIQIIFVTSFEKYSLSAYEVHPFHYVVKPLKLEKVKEIILSVMQYEKAGGLAVSDCPKIKVEIPIYHGTSESVLQAGVGHFWGTSLPVGGESTHTVLTGHRGLPTKTLFTNMDKLVEGDVFYIKVLDETLAYKVDQILTVLPEETEALSIVPGQDYATLVTCTPYAINTHRLLVRGHRIPYEEAVKIEKNTSTGIELSFTTKVLI